MKGRNLGIVIVLIIIVVALAGYIVGSGKSPKSKAPAVTAQQSGVKTTPGGHPPGAFPSDFNTQLKDLLTRLEKNPDDWKLNSMIGDIYFDTRNFPDAIGYYRRSIKLNPDDIDSYNDLALASHYMNNTLEGLKYVEEGIKRQPDYQRIWLTKGFLLSVGLGKKEEAIKAWDKVIEIDPSSQVADAARDLRKR